MFTIIYKHGLILKLHNIYMFIKMLLQIHGELANIGLRLTLTKLHADALSAEWQTVSIKVLLHQILTQSIQCSITVNMWQSNSATQQDHYHTCITFCCCLRWAIFASSVFRAASFAVKGWQSVITFVKWKMFVIVSFHKLLLT